MHGDVGDHIGSTPEREGARERITYPPLNRPSVINATSWPSPAPIIKLVGFNISGIPIKNRTCKSVPFAFPTNAALVRVDVPGPPLGPKYRITTTVFSLVLMTPFSTALPSSSSLWKHFAFPVNLSPSLPVIFDTDPPGAIFPRRIRI